MILRSEKGIPLTTEEMDNNIVELSQRVTLDTNQTISGIKSFSNFKTSMPDLTDNSNRIISTKFVFDYISDKIANTLNKTSWQSFSNKVHFNNLNIAEYVTPLWNGHNQPDIPWAEPQTISNVDTMTSLAGKVTVSETSPINPDTNPDHPYWFKISSSIPRVIEQVYKHSNGSWELVNINNNFLTLLHKYDFGSSFNDLIGSLNWVNYGLVMENGYVTGFGSTQFATLPFDHDDGKFYTYSLWVNTDYSFPYYQFILGTPTQNTMFAGNYYWFIDIFNNKIGNISSTFGDNLNLYTWYNIIASINTETKESDFYVNGVYVGSQSDWGGYGPKNNLQLGGFTDYFLGYAEPAKIASLEIYQGKATDTSAMNIYLKGMYP